MSRRGIRKSWLLAAVAAVVAVTALQPAADAARALPAVAHVGVAGNEPIVTRAPDGTLYISALQHLYVSTTNGASWSKVTTPPYASTLNLASDSSISVDLGGRLYFAFDWPYAGGTGVCVSDDRGLTWTCEPEAIPGVTDRMWVTAPTPNIAYLVTNEGLYQTLMFTSLDRGVTWVPAGSNTVTLQPQTGGLLRDPRGLSVVQPVNDTDLALTVWASGTGGTFTASTKHSGLPTTNALPSADFTPDGTLYVAGETLNASGGRQVQVARTTNLGTTWTTLPPVPGTTSGTATFSAVAAGANGDVGVLFYSTTDNGDPTTLSGSTWSVKWARSTNANTASPTWTVTTLETNVHTGHICAALSCDGIGRFAGDLIDAEIDGTGVARLTWMADGGYIRYANA